METIRKADLRPGDVLLFHGNGFLSKFIRFFDGSQYSHAAIWDGENVVEAECQQGNGICVDTIEKACSTAAFTHVYRYTTKSGRRFIGALPVAPVEDQIKRFSQDHEGYAYSQIVLLGLLLATRKIPLSTFAPLLRYFMDEAAEQLNTLINRGSKVIICSELVYKCYEQAGSEYEIDVAGVEYDVIQAKLAPRATLMPSVTPDSDAAHLEKDGAAFLASYQIAKPELRNALAAIEPTNGIVAVPEFVTPRDLATSPNLLLVGQVQP